MKTNIVEIKENIKWYRWANSDGSLGGWVSGDARVSGNAWVYGNARVSGNARVYGNAWVYGNAQVSGNAWVSGDAWEKSPLQIQGSRHFVTNAEYGYIRIGCEFHSFDVWKTDYRRIGEDNEYTDAEIEEYKQIIDLVIALGK